MLQTQWFADKIGQVVIRTSPRGQISKFKIINPEVAEYANSLQSYGYRFAEIEKIAETRTLNVCTSCEG